MLWSKMFIFTMREEPKDAEATSHKLMLRAGLIRKLSAGIYSYLPLGYKVLSKISNIVREEMNKSGAQELLMPALHPADIWKKTGRYDIMKDILMTIQKNEKQEIVLGPTHEEIITELVSGYVSSYKELPVTLYQIQNKFRDEARPRFGIIRSKEFIMKDAYSFDSSAEGLDTSYDNMYETYKRIFDRCGLSYEIVSADSGDMGGDVSHEFMVKVPFGEDVIVSCSKCDLSSSLDIAACVEPNTKRDDVTLLQKEEFATPGIKTIEDISCKYAIPQETVVKTLIYVVDENPVMCLVRGDFEICESKLKKVLNAKTIVLADEAIIEKVTGAPIGFAGPAGIQCEIKMIADLSVKELKNIVTGANKKDTHVKNINIDRDFTCSEFADIRYIKDGDNCPVCENGSVSLMRSLEIGHVFKLGTKYTKQLGARFTDNDGKDKDILMGCYGIGINRILAASIEMHSDEKGIKWPLAIAPFKVLILTVNQKQEKSVSAAKELYDALMKESIEVLYDDRDVRAGVKFNDADLIGLPFVVVFGDRNLKNNMVELKMRSDGSARLVTVDEIKQEIQKLL